MDVRDYEMLDISMRKCKKGVIWKDSVAHYCLNNIEENLRLEKQLKSGIYKSRPPYKFKITYPKPRDIVSISFRDRVYQRSINDNVLYPTMVKSFIYDNCACQIGKGTDFARDRLKCFLNRYYRKHGIDGYVLQMDMHGYYPNMLHKEVERIFSEKLDEEHFKMCKDVLDYQYVGEKGYNPGSQMVQIAGISYLDKFDHYCKEQLHLQYYIRYMDDVIIIHHDKKYLEECKEKIKNELNKVGCSFNENKTEIYKLNKGILFLGWNYRITKTGKCLMIINPKNIKAQRRKLKRLVKLAKSGVITKENVDDSFNCFMANLKKGNSHNISMRMKKYYNELWEEKNGNN